jgi:RimJ/RimL family protein N-acetyltransferase
MSNLSSKNLIYRTLGEKDVTERYVHWLNDPEINRYLEVRHSTQTINSCNKFVENINSDPTQYLFGIFIINNEEHIGNIKLGFVNENQLKGQMSLFIGEKKYWGKEYATESVISITKWSFDNLGLEKIEAGYCEKNIASKNGFLKAGYQLEGCFRKHELIDGNREDTYWLGILANEFS